MASITRLNGLRPSLHHALITRQCSSAPEQSAFAVILGGGVAGSSLAYHLTKRNVKDVILLEKSDVANPNATSFHSPGLVSASHPAHRYKPILAYSVDLYSKLEKETGEKVVFERPGTIRLATNETRLREFRRYVAKDYYREGDVCKTTLLTPDEVYEKAGGILDRKEILGGLFTSNDGYVDARGLNQALVAGAKKGGANIVQQTMPDYIKYDKSKGEWIIGLEDGSILRAKNLVNAGGVWANDIARLTGHSLPMVIVEHQYAILKPQDVAPPPNLPALIDHDSTFYVRKLHDDRYLFGGFEALDKIVFREDWYKKGVPQQGSRSVSSSFGRIKEAYHRAQHLIPSLQGAEVEERAATFSMTPDGYPLVGPFDKNYWVSTAFLDGVSSGGGLGKYLADWMVDGEPPSELFDTDASRYDNWTTREFITEKSRETYSMYYNWSYTNRLAGRPTTRISGVYGRLKRDGAHFSYRNGWEVPDSFNVSQAFKFEDENSVSPETEEGLLPSLVREYEMVTNKCGLIDMSWKGKLEVKGKDAQAFMEYACASNIPALGKIGSGLLLTRQGRLFAPMKIFHHDNARSQFIVLTEPERESRDLYWLRRAAGDKNFNVQVNPVSHYLASLALVGPNSRDLLSQLTKSDVSNEGFPMRSTRLLRLGAVAVVCARSSTSTGQLSYELFHNRADSAKLYDAIMRAGRPFGIVNFGQATMNMMRLEHGYKIWGRELTLDTNPYECGLGGLVNLEKEDFIGRSACLELSKASFSRRLALLSFEPSQNTQPSEWKTIPQGMEVVRRNGSDERIGQITSGCYSARLQKALAFAWIDSDVKNDEMLSVDVGLDHPLRGSIMEKIPHKPTH